MTRPDPEQTIDYWAERIRRIHAGETSIVDLRGLADPAAVASKVIAELGAQNREPDEFVLSAYQEQQLGVPTGSLKTLFGYPCKVVYDIAED